LWSQSIQIAGLSGDADALALSLAQSLAAVIAQWRSLCASMLSLGISLPMPPAFVLTIVGQP
jgi:CelD/BcsL family acetyltransferase involved in cellulose biosynthesis